VTGEPWLTKRELARKLGISERTVTRLNLPHVPVGGQNRYFMSEVERFLRDGPEEARDNVIPLRPRRGEGRAA
jgi:hypothetical protein